MNDLILLDQEDVHLYNLAMSELLLRKTLYKHGYNSSLEFPWFGDCQISSWDIIDLGEDIFKIVFEYVGYSVARSYKSLHSLKKVVYKITLPELNGWSAQRLNSQRKVWLDILNKEFHFLSSLYFFTKDRQTVLCWERESSIRCLLLDLAQLLSNFLSWRSIAGEVFAREFIHDRTA